jgi:hypothetical protein
MRPARRRSSSVTLAVRLEYRRTLGGSAVKVLPMNPAGPLTF